GLIRRLAGKADKIPTRIDEGGERVRFAGGRSAAARASDMLPRRMAVERIAGLVELDIIGEHYRELIAGGGYRPTLCAMNHRDRRAPVALTRHTPVPQAVLDRALAPAGGFGP